MNTEDVAHSMFDLFGKRQSLTRPRALELLGITASQWTRARAWMRDLFDEEPLLRNRVGGEWVYFLAGRGTKLDAREYWQYKLKEQITKARREYNEAHGIAEQHPTLENRWQEEMARQRLANLTFARDRFLQLELADEAA